jgi:4-diphosphocytidyl-2-C-methyl-D-erythritol kinase
LNAGATNEVRELAPAKVNLLLHVGPVRPDGLHELCSLFASIELHDSLTVAVAGADEVVCPGVAGPNLVATAVVRLREALAGDLLPLRVEIDKRIPVAAGLGGGSADAAAVLRAGNRLAPRPLDSGPLFELAATLGADVPSQVEPRHALVNGAGEIVEPLSLPAMALVLLPQERGLSTPAVYREADRLGLTRERHDPDGVRRLAAMPLRELVPLLDNDLQPAALALRPELDEGIGALRRARALTALVTGSGPTVFGVFPDRAAAEGAARALPGAVVTGLRPDSAAR